MTNFKSVYEDTDSVTPFQYPRNDINVIKQALLGEKHMNREYISVIVNDQPTVIFKRNIVAVTKRDVYTVINCVGDVDFRTKEDYASVVKKIIG